MTDDQVLFVQQSLVASSFYFGVAGGLVGAAIPSVCRFCYRAARGLFQWR
ncbi:hypothetical protein [Acidovorax delafieldii]